VNITRPVAYRTKANTLRSCGIPPRRNMAVFKPKNRLWVLQTPVRASNESTFHSDYCSFLPSIADPTGQSPVNRYNNHYQA